MSDHPAREPVIKTKLAVFKLMMPIAKLPMALITKNHNKSFDITGENFVAPQYPSIPAMNPCMQNTKEVQRGRRRIPKEQTETP